MGKDTGHSINIQQTGADLIGVGSSGTGNVFGKDVNYTIKANYININLNEFSKDILEDLKKFISDQIQLSKIVIEKEYEKNITKEADLTQTQESIRKEFYSALDQLFEGIMHLLSRMAPSVTLKDYFLQIYSSMIYAQVIFNFFNNLNLKICSELNLDSKQIPQIREKYAKIENQVSMFIHDPELALEIDRTYYQEFKINLQREFPNFQTILLQLEEILEFDKITEYLIKKEEQLGGISNLDDFGSLLQTRILEVYIEKNKNLKFSDLDPKNIVPDHELIKELIKEINDSDYGEEKEKLMKTIEQDRDELKDFEKRHYERWQKSLDVFEMMIQFSKQLGEKHMQRLGGISKVITGAKYVALLRLHSRSIMIAKEILVLLKSGYIDGAHARWATMHQLGVISLFLLENESIVSERYLDHSYIRRALESKDFNKYSSKTGYPPYTEDELRNFEEKTKQLVIKYGNDYDYTRGFGWIPTSITKKRNFRELEKLSKIDHLRPYFNWATNQVLGGAHAFDYLGVPESERNNTVFIGPSNHGVTDPIHSAALSLIHTTMAFLSSEKYPELAKDIDLLGRFADEVGNKAIEVTNEFENED